MDMSNHTPLEQYLAATIQMLMARTDGRDEDPYLDKLDELGNLLTDEDRQFIDEMGKDWATHYWCTACTATHPNSFKCSKTPPDAPCEGCNKRSSTILCQDCFNTGDFQ